MCVATGYLVVAVHALLEAVDFEVAVCDCRTDAILAEAAGLDAQLAEQGEDGRVNTPVALEFDNDKVVHRSRLTRLVIEKVYPKVDGEALGLSVVDKGNAVEGIFYRGDDVAEGVTRALREKFFAKLVVDDCLNRGNLYALLAGLAVVVFLLHLQEAVPRIKVGAGAHFGAGEMLTVVLAKHLVSHGSVPIDGAIPCDALAIVVLRRVTLMRKFEQASEFLYIRNKLRVRALHKAYGLHLFQRDGAHLRHEMMQFFVEGSHDFANLRNNLQTQEVWGGKSVLRGGFLCTFQPKN